MKSILYIILIMSIGCTSIKLTDMTLIPPVPTYEEMVDMYFIDNCTKYSPMNIFGVSELSNNDITNLWFLGP